MPKQLETVDLIYFRSGKLPLTGLLTNHRIHLYPEISKLLSKELITFAKNCCAFFSKWLNVY